MASVEKSVWVGRSVEEMFDLVENIENYPQFLPWCGATRVDYRDARKTIATLYVNFMNLSAGVTTENDKDYPKRMGITLVKGPFRYLNGVWRFNKLAEKACKVNFSVSCEFSSKMLDRLIAPMVESLANTFVEAFIRRADEIYGAAHG